MREEIRNIIANEILTTRELAEILSVNTDVIRQRIRRGKIEAVRKKDVWMFDKRDFKNDL